MVKTDKPLQIRLTEPVIFLRGPSTGLDFRGRPQVVQDAQPAMLRGLLTLRLSKPTRIRKIQIKLEGKSRTEWPEGIGTRRLETSEENIIISETTTYFNAMRSHSSHSATRRARSVGPGLPSAYWDQEDEVQVPWAVDRRASETEGGEGANAADTAEEDRGRSRASAMAPRSASAAPSFFGSTYSNSTGQNSHTTQSSTLDSLGVGRLSLRDRGPSPAYTPTPEPYENRRSSLRNSVSSASRLPDIPSSDRSISTSTERGRNGAATPPVGRSALSRGPVTQNDENGDGPTSALRPSILESGAQRAASYNEVRFAAEPPSASASDTESGRRQSQTQEGEGGETQQTNRTASIRTMNSRFSASSSSLASQHESTSEFHPVAAGVRTALPSAVNSPAPSAPPSIHTLSSTETLSRNATSTSLTQDSQNSSRPSEERATSGPNLVQPTASRMNSGGSITASSQSSSQATRHLQNRSSSRPSSTSLSQLPEDGAVHEHHKHKHHKFGGLHHALDAVKHKMSRSQSRPSSRAQSAAGSRAGSRAPSKPPSRVPSPGASRQISREQSVPHTPGSSSMSRVASSSGIAPAIPPHMLDQELRGVRHDRSAEDLRASSRARDSSRSRSRTVSPGRRDGERSPSRARGRNSGMKVLTGALGIGEGHGHHEDDVDDEEGAHNWKEFRKGVYNYPISFPIPANAPPTLHTEFGSVMYRLKATVVRVGALTSNLVESVEVTMIATPQEDDLEETENVIVERQWEEQMRYQIALHGKAFPIGGVIPISIRLMPLTKCRVHRLTVALEEKVDYYAQDRKVTRHETPRKYILLFIKQIDRLERVVPLLPIISDSPNAAKESPLAQMAAQAALNNPSLDDFDPENEDHVYASLYEPLGPWHLEKNLKIPDCQTTIKCTSKHEKTSIQISHWLKVTIRVERGDDEALDNKGKRKQFDIIIETPIKILDCRVNPQMNSLPTYSVSTPGASDATPGVCQIHGSMMRRFAPLAPSAEASNSGITTHISGIPGAPPVDYTELGRGRRHSRDRSGRREVSTHGGRDGEDSLLERNIVYDRLMSGQELETGEQPPTYVEALADESRSASTRGKSSERGRSFAHADEHGAIWVQSASRSRSRLRTEL